MLNVKQHRADIVAQLMAERHYLANERIEETDVRLVVFEDHSITINVGDVCYDTIHGVYCGAGTLNVGDTNAEIEALADEMIADVEDQFAEDAC